MVFKFGESEKIWFRNCKLNYQLLISVDWWSIDEIKRAFDSRLHSKRNHLNILMVFFFLRPATLILMQKLTLLAFSNQLYDPRDKRHKKWNYFSNLKKNLRVACCDTLVTFVWRLSLTLFFLLHMYHQVMTNEVNGCWCVYTIRISMKQKHSFLKSL